MRDYPLSAVLETASGVARTMRFEKKMREYEDYAQSRARFAASDQPTVKPVWLSPQSRALLGVSICVGIIFWMLGAK